MRGPFKLFRRRRHNIEPVRIADALREYPGMWVALKNGEIVEAKETPDALVMALKYRDIRDATIIRSPAEGEAELVGLG